jgi:predicted NUDIX family phosphoesterase
MDPAKAQERVLVIPAERFHLAGFFRGFLPYSEGYLKDLLDPAHFVFRARGEVETDPNFKQLIPYVVLRCRGEVFHYTRGSSGAETRLQALRSIGIGGHISEADVADASGDPYRAGMLRELDEEIEIDTSFREHPFGFIYDDSNAVGQVHLGVVHLLELEEPLAWPREAAIDEAGFGPVPDLMRHHDEFETWSQLVLDELARPAHGPHH